MTVLRDSRTASSYIRQSRINATDKLDVSFESVAVARLIEEIGGTAGLALSGYNRTYHRHNR